METRKRGLVPMSCQGSIRPESQQAAKVQSLLLRVAVVVLLTAPRTVFSADPHERVASPQSKQLTIMSFNIWGGGVNESKPTTETIAVLRLVNPDIVGLQETRAEISHCTALHCPPTGKSVTADLAKALGYFYYEQTKTSEANWSNAILSRYPILKATPNDLGVAIDVEGTTVYAFNLHLTDYPYQPYQLLGIEYGDAPFLDSAEEAVASASAAHQAGLQAFFDDLATVNTNAVKFVFGDFNQPSHRDWTQRAFEAGNHPMAVRYPSALAIEEKGFTDAVRWVYPDEVAHTAYTWAPRVPPSDPQEHHDRIDYVLVGGRNVRIDGAAIVGEDRASSDIVVLPWPSDHRAVTAKVTLTSDN